MTPVRRWSGFESRALRQALRLSVREFADHLGASARTVSNWEADGRRIQPRPVWQAALDTALRQATDEARARFELLLTAPALGTVDRPSDDDPATDADDTNLAAVLQGLRLALTAYQGIDRPPPSIQSTEMAAIGLHEAYQRADYGVVARQLPDILLDTRAHVAATTGLRRQRALRTQAVAYLCASKLASKAGEGQLAWLAADRAGTAAQLADMPAMSALATYQVACALLALRRAGSEVESLAVTAANELGGATEADLVSVRGSLLLLAALSTAREGDRRATTRYLTAASSAAEQLNRDDNRLWTAFGPTNVGIHRLSAAVTLDQPDRATAIGRSLDSSRLPMPLTGRRAQIHIELAAASMRRRTGDARAVLHLLEAERLAPQALRVNIAARSLLTELLSRERRAATPGLRPLAERAGLAG
jgi:transcriptional regulator with XRE-family HTH domain